MLYTIHYALSAMITLYTIHYTLCYTILLMSPKLGIQTDKVHSRPQMAYSI